MYRAPVRRFTSKVLEFRENPFFGGTIMGTDLTDIFGPPISVYTRAQAIDDGVLIDVSETAKECGVKHPVAVTSALWGKIEAHKRALKRGESTRGRLLDVLSMFTMKASHTRGDRFVYRVILSPRTERLYAVCGPGDDASPVITIMLEGED
jgi:hypothetical protein